MSDPTDLSATQAWMYAAITQPPGAGVAPGRADEMVTPSSTLTSEQRLSIYRRSYFARLLECMESMFPALRHAIGVDLFRRFSLGYLQANAPESYTLNRLADGFPAYLDETRPEAGPSGERETWPDFLIELAALELAFLQTFDGPGVEGQWIAGVSQILAIPAGRLVATPVPCLRLFHFQYPVHTYLTSCKQGQAPDLPDPKASFVAMTRREYRVRMLELSLPQYEVLQRLDGCTSLSSLANDFPGVGETVLADWLAEWALQGLILTVTEESLEAT
jgi:hypothetical protein